MSAATTEPLLQAVRGTLGVAVPADEVVDALDRRRMTYLARLLHYWIARRPAPAEVTRGKVALEALSEVAAGRLLRSPRLCELLRGVGPDDDVWSLLDSPTHNDSPVLACGVPLDCTLPARLGYPSAGLVAPRVPNASEVADAARRIDAAIDCVRELHPLGHRLLVALVRELVVRHDDGRRGECWGATSGVAIGRIVVVNPAVAGHPAVLGEVLLHEAVHCALDCAELEGALVVFASDGAGQVIRSPWTGAPLQAHAFVHATIVWTVLLGYWTGYRKRFRHDERARARLAAIARGFTSGELGDLVAPIADRLAPPAPAILANAWAAARAIIADGSG